MGRCLLGMGIGHAAEVLMLSILSDVFNGRGDGDRVCGERSGRGRAIVAIISSSEKPG